MADKKTRIASWYGTHKTSALLSLTFLGVGGILVSYLGLGAGWLALYIFAILLPVILGMMNYIDFKWVILWECIMLLPIGIIVLLIFGGAIFGLLKKS